MKIKISELISTQLDWAVAKTEGLDVYIHTSANRPWLQYQDCHGQLHHCPEYSTDWTYSGPIIEKEGIWVQRAIPGAFYARNHTEAYYDQGIEGKTYLEAAMRCYISNKLGNEIEIPKELI